jgi:hypothetical protein
MEYFSPAMVRCLQDNCLSVRMLFISTPKGQTTKQAFGDNTFKTCLRFQKLQMDMDRKLKGMGKLALNG